MVDNLHTIEKQAKQQSWRQHIDDNIGRSFPFQCTKAEQISEPALVHDDDSEKPWVAAETQRQQTIWEEVDKSWQAAVG